MKVVLVFLLVIACVFAALAQQKIIKISPISKECLEVSGITEEQIIRIRQTGQLENTPEVAKQVVCVLRKTNILNASDEIVTDEVKSNLKKQGASDDDITKIVQCNVKKNTPEETSVYFFKCAYKVKPDFSPTD